MSDEHDENEELQAALRGQSEPDPAPDSALPGNPAVPWDDDEETRPS